MPPRKRRAVVFVAVILLAGLCATFVHSRGGWVNALHLAPTRDSSTPATQGDFTLLEVQRPIDAIGNFRYTRNPGNDSGIQLQSQETLYGYGENDAVAGLWIKMPYPADDVKLFQLTAHASSGETFPLKASIQQGFGDERFLFTSLPGDYPGTLKYVDVSIADTQGHSARWRILRLPAMQHVITPPVQVRDTFNQDGVRLTLKAFREPYRLRAGEYIRYQLFPTVAPKTHQWEIRFAHQLIDTDWQPYPTGSEDGGITAPLTDATARQVIDFNHEAIINQAIDHPFVASDHWVRMTGTLQQFETYDETVTFHDVKLDRENGDTVFNVAQAQSVTTPSGITVTLPVQSKASFLTNGIHQSLGVLIDVAPAGKQNRLPGSPLVRTYRKPVRIDLDFAKPLGLLWESFSTETRRKYNIYVPKSEPETLKDFTVIVRQHVDLDTIPLSLTAPIQDKSYGAPTKKT